MNKFKKLFSISLMITIYITSTLSTSAQVILPEIPESNLITAPSIITKIDSLTTFETLISEENAATAIFEINENGNITIPNSYEESPLEISSKLPKTIPAFEVETETELENLLSNIGEDIIDFFIVSEDYKLLSSARENNTYARGVLRLSNVYKNEDGSFDLLKIRSDANTAGCHIIILPQEASSKTNTSYLQRLLMGVWVEASEEEYGTMTAILTGANGVITNQAEKIAAEFVKNFNENTMTRPVLIIGHRGMPGLYPENSLEGSLFAIEAGADIVENDIYITKDNVIVVLHDGDLIRTTNGSGHIETYTYDELKEFRIDTHKEYEDWKIPTLEEYFIEWKKLPKDNLLFVEIKSEKEELITELVRLIKEYDISDQVNVISFSQTQIQRLHEAMPEMSAGYLCEGIVNPFNMAESLKSVINVVQSLGSTFNHSSSGYTKEFYDQINAHGITSWPWTYRDEKGFLNHFLMGLNGLTTDYALWAEDLIKDCILDEAYTGNEIVIKEGDTIKNPFKAISYDGKRCSSCDFEILSGKEFLEFDFLRENITAKAAGEVYCYATGVGDLFGTKIITTSELVKITIQPDYTEEIIVGVVSVTVACIAVITTVVLVKRKKSKNT